MKADEFELAYSLTYRDVVDVLRLIDASGACQELRIELGELKLTVVRGTSNGAGPDTHEDGNAFAVVASRSESAPAVVEASGAAVPVAQADHGPNGVPITTPLAGTFYRAPAPGAPPFVEVGSVVKPDDPLCIIEVMKLMNILRAREKGTVRSILVENETPVTQGQTVMIVEPLTS